MLGERLLKLNGKWYDEHDLETLLSILQRQNSRDRINNGTDVRLETAFNRIIDYTITKDGDVIVDKI